jgi:hypothetical protein
VSIGGVPRVSRARSPSFNGLKLAPFLALFGASSYIIISSCPGGSDRRVLKSYEVKHYIKTTKAESFIVEPELLDTVFKSSYEGGIPADRIFVFRRQISPTRVWFLGWLLEPKRGRLDSIQ